MNEITKMLFLKVIVLQLLMRNLRCDCGKAGNTHSSYKIGTMPAINPEDSQVRYYDCRKGSILFYDKVRTCKKGKWTGRAPKCGNL